MAAGINIGIGSDTRDFKRGVDQGIIKPLEEVKDVFGDVARAGDKANDDLEKGFKNQQRDTKELRKEYDKLGQDIQDASRKGRVSMVNDSDAATTRGKANINELGNEAKANLAETLSSFDGTVEGTLSGIQGTLGGVTAGLTGVLPIILAAAGAAGIGALSIAFQTASEEAEKVRGKVAELAAEFIETGGVGERSLESMADALKELATVSEQGEKSLSDLAKTAKAAGLEFSDIAQAYVGNSDELEKLINKNADYIDSLQDEIDTLDVTTKAGNEKYGTLIKQASATEDLNSVLRTNLDVAKKAEQAERDYLASGAPEIEAKVERIKSIDSAYDEAAGSADKFIKKESGLFDVDAYIKAMQRRETALLEYEETLTSSALTPEAKAFLTDQGVETASLMLAGYKKATPANKAELERIWSQAGTANSGTYANSFKRNLPKDTKFKVTPTVDKNSIQKELNKHTYSVTIGAGRLAKKAV
jgi:hypothetical protein